MKRYRLKDIGKVVTGKTPLTKNDENFGFDVPFITPRDLNGSRFVLQTERSLSIQGSNTVLNSVIPKDAIVVSCIGSDMGKVGIAVKQSVTNQQINSLIVNENHCFMYVYYELSTKKDELISIAGGSALPILNKTDFENFEIYLPPLDTQKEIAHILGTLDDKIELNRKMNKTLEEIAQTLYKRWFIDFEFPSEDGKPYKSSGGEMVESELGPIPKGWRVGKISDIAKNIGIGPFGSSIKVDTFTDSGIPVISGQHLKGIRLNDNDYNYITEWHAKSLTNSLVYRGDVIFTHAGNIGQVAYIPNTSKYEIYIISQRQFYLRCDSDIMLPELVTLYYKTPIGQHNLLANTSSSGVPSISQPVTNLKRQTIIIPQIKLQMEYVRNLDSIDCIVAGNLHNIALLEDMKSNVIKGLSDNIFKQNE